MTWRRARFPKWAHVLVVCVLALAMTYVGVRLIDAVVVDDFEALIWSWFLGWTLGFGVMGYIGWVMSR